MTDQRIILWTLCVTLLLATVAIPLLMLAGKNVAAPVSLAVAAQWGALLVVYRERTR